MTYNSGAGYFDGPVAYGTCRARFTPSRYRVTIRDFLGHRT